MTDFPEDKFNYYSYLDKKSKGFESICSHCGECCGSKDDPCSNLQKTTGGAYRCRDYENRLGPQLTVSGKVFECVPIRHHIRANSLRSNCSYKSC